MIATREAVLRYAMDTWGDEPDCPFPGDGVTCVLRHEATRRWYAIIMEVPCRSLSLPGEGTRVLMNVKADPTLIGSLIGQPGFLPAWHMSHAHWLGVLLDAQLPMDSVIPLLDMSWALTRGGRKTARKP